MRRGPGSGLQRGGRSRRTRFARSGTEWLAPALACLLTFPLFHSVLAADLAEGLSEAKAERSPTIEAPAIVPARSNAWPALSELTNRFLRSPGGTKPPAPSPQAPGQGDINLALLESPDSLASSNVVQRAKASRGKLREEESGRLLERARKQREEGQATQARNNFVALIESASPDPVKRVAMIELALMAQEDNQLSRAQQIFSHFLKSYPQDPSVPEVTLRQGLLYRQMGVPTLALSKFYAVMTAALTLKSGSVPYYQRLVLQAQTEVADTHYMQGNFREAADFFSRLLVQETPELNKAQIQFKLIISLAKLSRHGETIGQAREFLRAYPAAAEEPEVRFLLAAALERAGQKSEALREVLFLLSTQYHWADQNPKSWAYWQQRAGNEIGNQLYQQADFTGALEVYAALAGLNDSPDWQWPVWYQMGLIYERLRQPAKAVDRYSAIAARQKDLGSGTSPGLQTIVEMAKWRSQVLAWQAEVEQFGLNNAQTNALSPLSTSR